jgi:hypothetical protein
MPCILHTVSAFVGRTQGSYACLQVLIMYNTNYTIVLFLCLGTLALHVRESSYDTISTVGIYPLKEGRHEDACPSVDLLSKGRWRRTASVKDRHAGRLVKCRAEQTTRNLGGTTVVLT